MPKQTQKTVGKQKATPSEIKNKKIGFFSAILLVIGSSIGAGVFLKNGEILSNVGGSYLLAIISWIFSIIGVICMGLALVEVSSVNTSDNLGVVGWVKTFCNKFLYKTAKNFMAFLYLPLNFFLMPYYAVMMFQDAFGWQASWWIVALISLAITLWFFIVSGTSSRAGNIQNWIITSVKFIPLVFAAIAGFVVAGITGNPMGGTTILPDVKQDHVTFVLLTRGSGILGIIGSIPAIAFAFDGFYNAAGMQSEMKEPKKTPQALLIGLLIVSIIDLVIGVSLLIGTSDANMGKVSGLALIPHWLIAVIEILIAFGILGIINGFAIYNPRYFEDLIKIGDLPCPTKYKSKLNPSRPYVGLIYSGIITFFFFAVLTLIGAFGYSDVNGYGLTQLTPFLGGDPVSGYDVSGGSLNRLYSFVDLMANWTSIIVFLFVLLPIAGALINRHTKKIKVQQCRSFIPSAWVCLIIIGLGMAFIIVSSFANIVIVASWAKDIGNNIINSSGNLELYSQDAWNVEMLGAIMTLVVLVVFIFICTIPSIFEVKHENLIAKGNKRAKIK